MENIENALYIVATPIGNISEMSERAKYVLSNVDFIACEDTREMKKLISASGIEVKNNKLISLHEHNEFEKSSELIEVILEGSSIAYTSDAGMPAISDPGTLIVDRAHDSGVRVIPVSGPSAVIDAIAVSGFSDLGFKFHGFFPRNKSEKEEVVKTIQTSELPVVFYESPKRLLETLKFLEEHVGAERRALVCREITKKFEEIKRGTFKELRGIFSKEIKGECVIVVEGNHSGAKEDVDKQAVAQALMALKKAGLTSRDAIDIVGKLTGLAKNELKEIYLGEN